MPATQFRTLGEVYVANRELGHHFFDRDTMRFFNSRVVGNLIGGRFFVTSERFDETTPRRYTVREVMPTGAVETVGDFQAHATPAAARRAIRDEIAAREELQRALGVTV